MKKTDFLSIVLVLQLIFSTMAFAGPIPESDDTIITINVTKAGKKLAWGGVEVLLIGAAFVAYGERVAIRAGLPIPIRFQSKTGMRWLKFIARFGLAGSIALPILYFYLRSKNSTWVSSVSPEDLKDQFLDIKEKQVAWDQDISNPYLEIDYLVERKFYNEQVIDYALSYNFEGREELLATVEASIIEDSDRLTELQEALSLLSDLARLAHLQTTIDIENNTDADLLRTELAQKYEKAILTLEAAL